MNERSKVSYENNKINTYMFSFEKIPGFMYNPQNDKTHNQKNTPVVHQKLESWFLEKTEQLLFCAYTKETGEYTIIPIPHLNNTHSLGIQYY